MLYVVCVCLVAYRSIYMHLGLHQTSPSNSDFWLTRTIPEGPADPVLPRDVGALQQRGRPRPLAADDSGDQARLDAAPRSIKVLAGDVRAAVLGCGAWGFV